MWDVGFGDRQVSHILCLDFWHQLMQLVAWQEELRRKPVLGRWPRWEDDYVNLFHGGCHLPDGVYLSSSHSVPFLNQKMC